MLTIILPVKQSWIKLDCFFRLIINIIKLKNNIYYKRDFNILIADDSKFIFRFIIYVISLFFQVNYLSIDGKRKNYCPANVKNKAALFSFEVLNVSSILFLDVDVLLSDELIKYIINKKDITEFDWYPVDFLNKRNSILSMIRSTNNEYLNSLSTKDILQTGYVTGLQTFSKEFFYKTRGYNENYINYGCEDIDMLHRATLMLKIRKRFKDSDNYYIDDRGYNPNKLVGFRNFYFKLKSKSKYSFKNAKHFYHKRKNKSSYMKTRKTNDLFLISAMKEFDKYYRE